MHILAEFDHMYTLAEFDDMHTLLTVVSAEALHYRTRRVLKIPCGAKTFLCAFSG